MSETPSSIDIPPIGLGTWDLRGQGCIRAVRQALEIGYRHIDTAEMYENEREVGRGIRESGVPRETIFLTTKLWTNHLTKNAVPKTAEASLRRLETDYVDLLLIHWPNESVPLAETLGAMERVRESGKARHIGVSNFPPRMWREALELAPVAINQVEFHLFLQQDALLALAEERGLHLVAYSPLAKGRIANDPRVAEIARTHGRTPAQVALRWLVQHPRLAAIPKAARREHLEENFHIFDFELDEKEMRAFSSLGKKQRVVDPAWAPDWNAT
jgi:2,5-diketo-D-gluconate reductase B